MLPSASLTPRISHPIARHASARTCTHASTCASTPVHIDACTYAGVRSYFGSRTHASTCAWTYVHRRVDICRSAFLLRQVAISFNKGSQRSSAQVTLRDDGLSSTFELTLADVASARARAGCHTDTACNTQRNRQSWTPASNWASIPAVFPTTNATTPRRTHAGTHVHNPDLMMG